MQQRLSLATSSPSAGIIETFNIAHASVIERISNNSLIPAAFNPQIDEVRRLKQQVLPPRHRDLLVTKQPNLIAVIQSRHLSIFGHIARMDNDADAKVTLTAPLPDNWRRPPGRPCIMWLNTVQRDLRAYNLTLNKAVDLAQNRPLWRLMSTYGATHS